MDTSKEYIKMCDCPEAQVGGYTTLNSEKGIQYVGDNVFVELDRCSTTWRTVRLLRQSQIQEMVSLKHDYTLFYRGQGRYTGQMMDDMNELIYGVTMDSMEQLWLAFYMFENHQKVWDGEKWVKSVKE